MQLKLNILKGIKPAKSNSQRKFLADSQPDIKQAIQTATEQIETERGKLMPWLPVMVGKVAHGN